MTVAFQKSSPLFLTLINDEGYHFADFDAHSALSKALSAP